MVINQLPRKDKNAGESAQAEHLRALSILCKGFFSSRDKIPFVLGEQLQHKNGWELIQAPVLPLLSLDTLSALQTLLTKDLTLEFEPQAQATARSTGLWELGSTVLI